MTKILFLPNDQTLILLNSPLPPEALAAAAQSGEWRPPPPYDALTPPGAALQAVCQDGLVMLLPGSPTHPAAPDSPLSPRQQEVLQALADGLTTKEIAFRLGLSHRTVSMHIAALKTRFGTRTRAQTVGRALALGLCRLPRENQEFKI